MNHLVNGVTGRKGKNAETHKVPEQDLNIRHSWEDEVMTANEVTEYLRIHRTTFYRLLKRKEIPAFRMGSDWRFSRQAIDRWRLSKQG
jgi:excisionase family DNA binding protein